MSASAPAETHSAAAPPQHPPHHEEHHGPTVKMYFAIFFALCVLGMVSWVKSMKGRSAAG